MMILTREVKNKQQSGSYLTFIIKGVFNSFPQQESSFIVIVTGEDTRLDVGRMRLV